MSGLSNYPPGVSGNEWEIAGPDTEVEDAIHLADQLGLPQPGLFGSVDEIVLYVRTWLTETESYVRNQLHEAWNRGEKYKAEAHLLTDERDVAILRLLEVEDEVIRLRQQALDGSLSSVRFAHAPMRLPREGK